MRNMFVTTGDITHTVAADAIVTLINTGGAWHGGVDGAIQRVADQQYHSQARTILESSGLHHGQTVVAKGNRANHSGNFNDVIFVVDAFQSPLSDLVYVALQSAKQQGYSSVAFPLMRSGLALGVVERDVQAVVRQMRLGIDRFLAEGDAIFDIYIVIYDEPGAVKMLSSTMQLLNP